MPPPSPQDVFLDLEGYPFAEGGLEYLFGLLEVTPTGADFVDFWGHDRAGERAAFEAAIDQICSRFRRDSAMHVYHYAAYERAAFRRLADSHVTRQAELDMLERAGVFVDLYAVVKQGIRIGTPSYSLKAIERLYRAERDSAVSSAGESVAEYGRWCAEPDGATWKESAILAQIRAYNEDDVVSTAELAAWLRARQAEAGIAWSNSAAAPAAPQDAREEEALAAELLARDADGATLNTLLAHLLGFYRREIKPQYWEYFDRHGALVEELVADGDCLGGLQRTATPPVRDGRWLMQEYRFDASQDWSLKPDQDCSRPTTPFQKVRPTQIDAQRGLAIVRSRADQGELPEAISLIPEVVDRNPPLIAAVRQVAARWHEDGSMAPALTDLLERRAPRFRSRSATSPLDAGSQSLVGAVQAIAELDGSLLAIQGPPGTGKTFLAAHAIVALIQKGARVGVSSTSHKAIEKLMVEVLAVADRAGGAPIRAAKVQSKDHERGGLPPSVALAERADKLKGSPNLVGGTVWAMSHAALAGQLDTLFVDEAGQVSLANTVAMAGAARNIVLVGDPAQLPQPLRGNHPGESGTSALEYLLNGQQTIPKSLGLFLDASWRLHPALCSFISDAFYEGRLAPMPGNERREIAVPAGAKRIRKSAGLVYVPVAHEGNVRTSSEEVAQVVALVQELLGRPRTDRRGQPAGNIGPEDILIVAPFNAQVRRLAEALPACRVGTVDKFQGQEAPVVIASMAASSTESSARGAEFLLSPNRLNVALSRAQSLAIVVASPELAKVRARSLDELRLTSLFCRIAEFAE